MDSQTAQPIADVVVQRLTANESYRIKNSSPPIRTSTNGTFVLDSLPKFWPVKKAGWYAVSLSFEHPDYLELQVLFTRTNATKSWKSEPLVKAGDILLVRLSQ